MIHTDLSFYFLVLILGPSHDITDFLVLNANVSLERVCLPCSSMYEVNVNTVF